MAANPDDLGDALDPSRYERVQGGLGHPDLRRHRSDGDPDPVTNEVLRALDVDSWASGLDLTALEDRMEREIELAVRNEEELMPRIRERLKRDLANTPGTPRG